MKNGKPAATPDISYIISAYDRPKLLAVVLYALRAQTHENFEAIVTDNATDPATAREHQRTIRQMRDPRFRYVRTAGHIAIDDCYWSAEYAARRARGTWLCFPCDDCYYVPTFAEKMLGMAKRFQWDLVCCDVLYRWNSGQHGVLQVNPGRALAAKSCFLVRRERFKGFRNKPHGKPAPSAADATAVLDICGNAPHGVLQEILVVHN